MQNWFEGSNIQKRHNKYGVSVVLGSQWGDEGKGKVTDVLAQYSDVIIRFNGGHNAGHTVEFGEKSFDLHILPSGMVSEDKINIITSGCVVGIDLNKIDLELFESKGNTIICNYSLDEILKKQDGEIIRVGMIPELEKLEKGGINLQKSNLKISGDTPVIGMHNVLLDAFDEVSREFVGLKKIGSTGSGISRSYANDIQRYHFTVNDLLYNSETFYKSLRSLWIAYKNIFPKIDVEVLIERTKKERKDFIEIVKKYNIEILQNEQFYIKSLLEEGKKIVGEGAQSAMIGSSNSFFGTSSDPSILRFLSVTGLKEENIGNIFLIFKMPSSSVGIRPGFLKFSESIELDEFRNKYKEFGVSTKRPRNLFEYSLVEASRGASLNLNSFSDMSKIVPVYNRVDGIEDSMKLSDGDLRVVLGYSYNKTDLDGNKIKICVGISKGDKINSVNLLQNYPSKSLQINTFDVERKDIIFYSIPGNNNKEKIAKLLACYNGAIFDIDNEVEYLIGTGPKRQDLELKKGFPLRKI